MPTKFNRLFARPSVDVEFPIDPDEFTQHAIDTYVSTGKCIEHRVASYSEDKLVKTCRSVWIDEEAYNEALPDPAYAKNHEFLTQYCNEHDIFTSFWTE
jgi:hypothetical protein